MVNPQTVRLGVIWRSIVEKNVNMFLPVWFAVAAAVASFRKYPSVVSIVSGRCLLLFGSFAELFHLPYSEETSRIISR